MERSSGDRLQELGLIDKERPFGESEKTGKRILYKMADPFFRLWFRVVAAHRALLAEAPASVRIRLWQQAKPALLSQAWEELCRQSVPLLTGANVALADAGPWEPARRYWHGQGPEWDLAAWSTDRKRLLLGEIKWTTGKNAADAARQAADVLLKKGIPPLDKANPDAIVRAVFVPEASRATAAALRPIHVIDAAAVLSCLR